MAIFDKKKLRKIKEKEKTIKNHTIMVVDDEESHLSSMKSLFVADYNIITACDGQEALDIIGNMEKPENICLIISDQRMPKVTGIELFEQLINRMPNTIRILLTGYIDIPVTLDAINKAKIYQFIQKPFEPEDLKLRVKRAVEAFEQNEKLQQKNKELEEANRKLEESSLIDQLTGLRNRRYISEFIESDISKVQRYYENRSDDQIDQKSPQKDLTFMILDVDKLKSVNIQYNCKAGDSVLKQLTKILQDRCRKSDILVRWGSDEFLVVICYADRDVVHMQAERLRQGVKEHRFDLGNGQSKQITCSIGFATYPFLPGKPESLDWEKVVNIAEKALNVARNSGGDAWLGISSSDKTKSESLINDIPINIKKLISNGELSVYTSMPQNVSLDWHK